ncbi:hypothetical protein IWW57_001732 [Coemansia sp. S610]|nr:hypothetical protein IWW57_001732 [Coemansia sp. S610]
MESVAAAASTQQHTGPQPQQPPQVLPSGATVIQPGGMMPPPPPQLISPPSVNEHGIPTVGSSVPQRPQPSTGTPIVIGMPGNGMLRPEPRPLLQGRRESAINPPSALAPGPPHRLASLSSPMSQASALEMALHSPLSSSRRSGFGSQLNSPRVKRNRTTSNTPEPKITLKIKTADDYRLLDSDTVNSLPIGFFCRDTRHGVPTEEFIENENNIVRRINEGSNGDTKKQPEVKPPVPEASKKEEPAASSNFRVAQVRIVDGKAVVDSDSLVINRREMADANQGPLELVDESSRPRFVNSLTYAPLRGTRKRWSPEENEMFFRALRTYGTDFAMIASVIPERNRYDIKNKFKKEEKLNSKRITDLLLRRPEPVAAALPVTPTVGPDGLPVSLHGYSMVNTPEPQQGAVGDADDEELPNARSVVTFATNTK